MTSQRAWFTTHFLTFELLLYVSISGHIMTRGSSIHQHSQDELPLWSKMVNILMHLSLFMHPHWSVYATDLSIHLISARRIMRDKV